MEISVTLPFFTITICHSSFFSVYPVDDEDSSCLSGDSSVSNSDDDDDKVAEGCGSPRMQRKRRLKKLRERMERRDSAASHRPIEELMYDDNLPEVSS